MLPNRIFEERQLKFLEMPLIYENILNGRTCGSKEIIMFFN